CTGDIKLCKKCQICQVSDVRCQMSGVRCTVYSGREPVKEYFPHNFAKEMTTNIQHPFAFASGCKAFNPPSLTLQRASFQSSLANASEDKLNGKDLYFQFGFVFQELYQLIIHLKTTAHRHQTDLHLILGFR